MKLDRFTKLLLVLACLLLAINCVTNFPLIGSRSEASAPPAFLQVGKTYIFDGNNTVKITKIDSSGWVQADEPGVWFNTNNLTVARER